MNLLNRLLDRLTPAAAGGGRSQQGIGRFSGHPALPQDPRATLTRDILPSLSGSPGIRLSSSTDRAARYFGTDAVPPVRFPVTGPKGVNRPVDLEVAAIKSN